MINRCSKMRFSPRGVFFYSWWPFLRMYSMIVGLVVWAGNTNTFFGEENWTSWYVSPCILFNLHELFTRSQLSFFFFFWIQQVMETAGKKFIGEHDFRNFCKMDAANVHNYKRHIRSFEIATCNERCRSNT